MNDNKNYKTLVRDFLTGKIPDAELKRYVRKIRSLNKGEQSLIYEEIYSQVSELSHEDQRRLLNLLKSLNPPEKAVPIKRIVKFLPYVAIFLAVMGIAFFSLREVSYPPETVTTLSVTSPILKVLEDGSEVWLFEGAALEVAKYDENQRVVKLEGKARFSVKPSSSEFLVTTNSGLFTKVLGTEFMVSSEEDDFEVSVEKGRVWVGDEDQMLAVLSAGEWVALKDNIWSQSTAFKENQLLFSNVPFHKVLKTLETKFGVHINLESEEKKEKYTTARFRDDLTLVEIIDILCEIHDYSWTIVNEEINIIAN